MSYPAMLGVVMQLSLTHYKRFMVGMLGAGLLAVALEIGAFSLVLGGIAVLSGGDLPDYAERLLVNTSGRLQVIAGVAAFFILMLLAAAMHYTAGWLAARCRKATFADNITRTLRALTCNPDHPFVSGRGSKDISRALRRDCRYSSLALVEFIALPRPLLVAALCIGAGFVFYPVIAAIALLILLLSLPIHLRTGRYGIDIMERLIAEGARKGRADRDVVEALLASPWRTADTLHSQHIQRDDVQGFLNAYEERVALAPVTQFTSRIVSTIVFAAVGAYLFWMYMDGRLQLTDVAVIFIAFRIFNGAAAEIVQQLVIIVSYSPIMKQLFEFFRDSGVVQTGSDQPPSSESMTAVSMTVDTETGTLPDVFAIIDLGGPTRQLGGRLSGLKGLETDPILAIPVPIPDDYLIDMDQLKTALSGPWSELSDALKGELMDAASGLSEAQERALALLPVLLSRSAKTRLVLADAKAFLQMSAADQAVVERCINKVGPLALIYRAYPKRYPLRFEGGLFARDGDRIVPIAGEDDFFARRELSISRPLDSGGGSASEMDDGF